MLVVWVSKQLLQELSFQRHEHLAFANIVFCLTCLLCFSFNYFGPQIDFLFVDFCPFCCDRLRKILLRGFAAGSFYLGQFMNEAGTIICGPTIIMIQPCPTSSECPWRMAIHFLETWFFWTWSSAPLLRVLTLTWSRPVSFPNISHNDPDVFLIADSYPPLKLQKNGASGSKNIILNTLYKSLSSFLTCLLSLGWILSLEIIVSTLRMFVRILSFLINDSAEVPREAASNF